MHERPPVAEDAEPARPAAADLAPPPLEIEGPASPTALRRLALLAAVDIGPLRHHRDYRLLYIGRLISFFGSMITFVAVPYQAYALTHSSLVVGLFGVVQLVPLLLLAFLGGALADAVDRRRLVLVTELALGALSGALLVNALVPRPQLWVLYIVAALASGCDALQRPALDAILPRLVERDELAAAGALNTLRGTFAMILGPAVAGLLIAGIGLPATFGVDVATFAVSLVMLGMMRAVPPPEDAERPSLRRIADGLRYAQSRPELMGTYLVDIVAMFFGMPIALFPALAAQYARENRAIAAATALGLLYTAPAVGAFLASATSGWTRHVHRHGRAVILAAGAWGWRSPAWGWRRGWWARWSS